jgi:hypothetical protein
MLDYFGEMKNTKNLNKMRKGSDTRGKLKSTVYIDESLESLQHVYVIILILVQSPFGDFGHIRSWGEYQQEAPDTSTIKYVYICRKVGHSLHPHIYLLFCGLKFKRRAS